MPYTPTDPAEVVAGLLEAATFRCPRAELDFLRHLLALILTDAFPALVRAASGRSSTGAFWLRGVLPGCCALFTDAEAERMGLRETGTVGGGWWC